MKKFFTKLSEKKLVGIATRTKNLSEKNPGTAKISRTLDRYFVGGLNQKTPNRLSPGVTYCVYADYESDEHGEYTCFVGEEVKSFASTASGLESLVIAAQDYVKFEVGPGVMPKICIEAWQKIWQMSEEELGGERNYIADFEVYDEKSSDKEAAIFNIYIGIKSSK